MNRQKREIGNTGRLLRRVHPEQNIFDDNLQRWRPTSAAFTHQEMSVDVENFMLEENVEAAFSLRNTPQHNLVAFSVQIPIDHELPREHTPCPEDQPDNPFHADVLGKKRHSAKEALSLGSEWLVFNKPTDGS